MKTQHFVYMLACRDETYYIGYTTDLKRRVNEHNTSPKAAKYTRGRRPVTLVYYVACESRSDALKTEHALRKLTRSQKEALIEHFEIKNNDDG